MARTRHSPDSGTLDDLLGGLRAVGETTRLRILALCAEGDLTVGDLTQILGQSQPRVSRHLKLLCEAGVIERLPEGTGIVVDDLGAGLYALAVMHLLLHFGLLIK